MAGGALPVVSDLEGNREWVEEGEGARLFPPGDAKALAHALERVLDQPAWAERACARNRRAVEQRGDAARNMARIESLLTTLAGTRRSPGAGDAR